MDSKLLAGLEFLDNFRNTDFIGENKINCWRITRDDLEKMLANIFSYSAKGRSSKVKPTLLDIGCGTGLCSYLFSISGINTRGIAHTPYNKWKDFMISAKEKGEELKLEELKLHELWYEIDNGKLLDKIDVVYCSWMPSGKNWSNLLYSEKINPRMVIQVIGKGTTGIQENHPYFAGKNPDNPRKGIISFFNHTSYDISLYPNYSTVLEWEVADNRDFERGERGQIVLSNRKSSKVRIDVRRDLI